MSKLKSSHDKEFTGLKWSPQSPNLNPVEHIWEVISILHMQLTNLQQLRGAIMSIWTKSEECSSTLLNLYKETGFYLFLNVLHHIVSLVYVWLCHVLH